MARDMQTDGAARANEDGEKLAMTTEGERPRLFHVELRLENGKSRPGICLLWKLIPACDQAQTTERSCVRS